MICEAEPDTQIWEPVAIAKLAGVMVVAPAGVPVASDIVENAPWMPASLVPPATHPPTGVSAKPVPGMPTGTGPAAGVAPAPAEPPLAAAGVCCTVVAALPPCPSLGVGVSAPP